MSVLNSDSHYFRLSCLSKVAGLGLIEDARANDVLIGSQPIKTLAGSFDMALTQSCHCTDSWDKFSAGPGLFLSIVTQYREQRSVGMCFVLVPDILIGQEIGPNQCYYLITNQIQW